MRPRIVRLTVLLCAALLLSAGARPPQPPAVQWSGTYAPWSASRTGAYTVIQTRDGGYLAGGFARRDSSGPRQGYLVKTDSLGNAVWQVVDSEFDVGSIHSAIQTSDGGFAVTGQGWYANTHVIYLAKLDSAGDWLWRAVLDSGGGTGYSVVQTPDAGFAVAGWSKKIVLLRADSLGTLLWRKEYYVVWPPSENVPLSRTVDGGYIIGAKSLIKVDSLGNQQWARTYDRVFAAVGVATLLDKGYIATGFQMRDTSQPLSRMYLLRTDSLGGLVWKKTYAEGGLQSLGFWTEPVGSQGFAAVGIAETDSLFEGYVVRTDALGNSVWTMLLGAMTTPRIRPTRDGGFIVSGSGRSGLRLVKLAVEQAR